MGGGASTTMESKPSEENQHFQCSEHQNPQNGVAPQNPQSAELGPVKPQSSEPETTPVSSSDHHLTVIGAELKPQMLPVESKGGSGAGNGIDGQNGLDEDGILRKTLDEEIHQVIYKEALNEAVMNLALGEDRNGEVEVGLGMGTNGEEFWEGGSDVQRGRGVDVDELFQGRYGNDDVGGEVEGEENYGTEEASGYSGDRTYNRRFEYPLRLDAEDCAYYMKTGSCKFGMNCKFNHPPKRRNQGTRDKAKPRVEDSERLGQTECKYYLTSGGCKFGSACKYNHSREKSALAPVVEFNFLGLPIRPQGEKECPYYMRTGSCKYGSNCKFNHPDPTSVAGNDHASGFVAGGSAQLHGAAQPSASSWSSASMIFPPAQGMPSNAEWNGYQATVYPTSERSLPTPPAFAMNNPVSETNFYAPLQQQMPVDEYPQRPGQPDCSYFLKTGDCKYKANCRFNHPKFQSSKSTSCALSDKGLPLRPDQSICSFYNRYGICKFGPACKFDHPENWGKSVASGGVRMARNEMEAGFS
ncbi:zinc finger CCCH domain-containing protein 67-like isoform X1 [Coffea arabica]|uniref:Zinc finger CCCH domain-containing protein 67-like isoform X1 n=1 Tax=Coffea arabica TaxID=13443 RepID=A0ABM4U436_COFAR